MADIRPLSGAPVPSRPLPAQRAEAIKAAQRAFFDQAFAASPASPGRATEAAAPVVPATATRLSFDSSAPAPPAPLRPGSLLDIKV